jgi:ubiquinone/menaquinone biosynthesis C-methylase UbiE
MILEKLLYKNQNVEVRKYFDSIASQWDSLSKEFYTEAVRERIYSMISPEPGNMIADLGAGTGFLSEGLKDGPASIIAVDKSSEMLKHMKLKFQDARNIDYRVGDATQLPIKNNIIDYALANMYLHHVDDPPKAIREIYRILKSGGRMIIADLNSHHFEYFRTAHLDRWLGFEHDDIRSWMESAGFSTIEVYSIQEYCYDATKPEENAKISVFLATGVK